jgi:hypothetical protein
MIHYGVNIGYVLPDIFHKQSNRQLQELSIRRMRKFYAFSLSGGIGFLLF